MKSLAILLKWVCVLFSLRLGYLIFRQVSRIIDSYSNEFFLKELIFNIKIPESIGNHWFAAISIFSCLLLIYLIHKLNILRMITSDISKKEIFTAYNGLQLISIGKGIIIFGIILSIIETSLGVYIYIQDVDSTETLAYKLGYSIGYPIGIVFFKRLHIFIIALFILMIAKLINEGTLLKQENDLTI